MRHISRELDPIRIVSRLQQVSCSSAQTFAAADAMTELL